MRDLRKATNSLTENNRSQGQDVNLGHLRIRNRKATHWTAKFGRMQAASCFPSWGDGPCVSPALVSDRLSRTVN
jgi:hypothetical protein